MTFGQENCRVKALKWGVLGFEEGLHVEIRNIL